MKPNIGDLECRGVGVEIHVRGEISMQGKQFGKLIPLALVLLLVGIWSARASLFEIYDAAAAASAKLDSMHSDAREASDLTVHSSQARFAAQPDSGVMRHRQIFAIYIKKAHD